MRKHGHGHRVGDEGFRKYGLGKAIIELVCYNTNDQRWAFAARSGEQKWWLCDQFRNLDRVADGIAVGEILSCKGLIDHHHEGAAVLGCFIPKLSLDDWDAQYWKILRTDQIYAEGLVLC